MAKNSYKNNPNLPSANYKHVFTRAEMTEFVRCQKDPVYFSTKYMKIINVDKGLMPFDMWGFQKKMLTSFHENRFNICKLPRQVGKSTTAIAYMLHYIIFNESVNVAILANKASTARELMGRLQLAFEWLPNFLKMGVLEWNKGSVELSNGSKIMADSTTGGSVRGRAFNLIFLDEFAFVPQHIAEAFFSSTYPTISSGETTKVIIVSTPNGLNLFYKMWMDSIDKRSHYVPTEIHWSMIPGRDEAWKKETIANTSEDQFRQEFECEFIGSTNTLINPAKIRSMVFKAPIFTEGFLKIYEHPIKTHTYITVVDVAEGQGLDYSTFSVIDVTEIPYKQVAVYRNNKITPYIFPTVIVQTSMRFNQAYILVEINSIGLQVADIINYELSYDNLLKFMLKGRQGQFVSAGHVKKTAFGIKT